MSNKRRNPFKMRASEKIESDANFLRLFSSDVLELLVDKHDKEELWDNVILIRSSPGAGKTSLLRIFEPGPLNIIYNQKSQDHKELFNVLKKLNVVSDSGIEMLGVMIRCTRNYEILEDLSFNPAQKIRLFYSLLNARIILATLRAIIEFKSKELSYPDGLADVKFNYSNEHYFFRSLKAPCTGLELFEWASNIEKLVYEEIDSFLPVENPKIEGHDELYSLSVLKPEYFEINGSPICNRFLFMVDDAHKLSTHQHHSLFNYIIEQRNNSSIWISERLEVDLYSGDTLTKKLSSYIDRDYNEINLERFWGDNSSKFKKVLAKIATKRADMSTEDVNTFLDYLENEINESENKAEIEQSIDQSLDEIGKLSLLSSKFENWIAYLNEQSIISFERAIITKEAEILINRSLGKQQLTFEFPLVQEELTEKMDSNLENAAKLFISKKHKIPYYYGFQDLVIIASNNIEQFITFAANLFEGMLSNKISGTEVRLSPERQEKIIKDVVAKKWKDLNVILPESTTVMRFIEGLGKYFQEVTYKSTASYAPGINGFAIKEPPLKLINDDLSWENTELYYPLVDSLNICMAFNLLETKEVIQGKKGQRWIVYYLNRWLCVKYNLPLSYGGWNKINPDKLLLWTKRN